MAEEVIAGPQAVVDAITARLGAQVRVELSLLEAKLGRPVPAPTDPDEPDLWRIPGTGDDDPGLFASTPRVSIQPEEYPAFLTVLQGTRPTRIEDMDEGRPTRRVPYVLRTWVLCRHWGFEEVSAARNRYAIAVEQVLLRSAVLGVGMEIKPDGWTSSYSDVDVADDDTRAYAGWWLEYVVESVEHLGDVMLAGGPDQPLGITIQVHPEAD